MSKEERETWAGRPDTWVSTIKVPLRDEEGKIVGTFGISRDITMRLRMEAALREAEEQYRALVESATDLVFQVDAEGRSTFLNQAAREIYGADPEDLLGRPFVERVAPEHVAQDRAAFVRVLAGERVEDHETVHQDLRASGARLSISALPARDAQGRPAGVIGIARDVSGAVRLRVALEEARDVAVRASVAKAAFLANMSHEIRTPLNSILGMIEILLDAELRPERSARRGPGEGLGGGAPRHPQQRARLLQDRGGARPAGGHGVRPPRPGPFGGGAAGGPGVREGHRDGGRHRPRPAAVGPRGPGAAAPGADQPGGERRQVHAQGRSGPARRAPADGRRPGGGGVRGARHGDRHPRREAADGVRGVRAGRCLDDPALRRHRAGPRDLQAAGPADGGRAGGGEHGGERDHGSGSRWNCGRSGRARRRRARCPATPWPAHGCWSWTTTRRTAR